MKHLSLFEGFFRKEKSLTQPVSYLIQAQDAVAFGDARPRMFTLKADSEEAALSMLHAALGGEDNGPVTDKWERPLATVAQLIADLDGTNGSWSLSQNMLTYPETGFHEVDPSAGGNPGFVSIDSKS